MLAGKPDDHSAQDNHPRSAWTLSWDFMGLRHSQELRYVWTLMLAPSEYSLSIKFASTSAEMKLSLPLG